MVQAQVDGGGRPGPSIEELAEIKALRSQVRDLTEANEILKAASTFFAGELDPRRRGSACSSTSSEALVVGSSRSAASLPSWAAGRLTHLPSLEDQLGVRPQRRSAAGLLRHVQTGNNGRPLPRCSTTATR